jgi:hypothetical protein
MRPPVLPPNIIDIEASGFAAEGYPIEVGIALTSGAMYCSLVCPEPGWTYWDKQAEAVHRVPRDILELYGRSVRDVARQMNDLLGGQVAYSDGWEVDKPWLAQLFWAAGITPRFQLSTLELILSNPQMECWHMTKDQIIDEMNVRRHRASIDARLIQTTYMRTLEHTEDISN